MSAVTLRKLSYIAALCIAGLVSGEGMPLHQGFLGRDAVSVAEMKRSIRELLQAAHSGGHTPMAQHLAKIEATVAGTFQALPKNAVGRLGPRSVRHIVHNYFAKEHGWQLQGLEPQGMRTNVSEVHDVSILQDRSPALVEALVEAQLSDRGLALGDVAAMVALLERLILNESVDLLEASYFLNGLSSGEGVPESELHEILTSYLLVFEMGLRGDLEDVKKHRLIKEKVSQFGESWPAVVEFETNALMNHVFQTKNAINPFVERRFTFGEAAQIVDVLAQGFGKHQNAECSRMRDALMAMDTDGSGLIPLSTFYTKSNKREYQFTESVEYLRQIGAVDDSWKREPRVRVANYVIGPSNCIASSSYYSVCCLSECDDVMHELERSIQAPTATPERILQVVQKLASTEVSADLVSKLRLVSEENSGEVPLHGRLFAQWLHLAFPHDCPFPHIAEGTELRAHDWLGGKAIASAGERESHVKSVLGNETSSADQDLGPSSAGWSDEELLPLQETKEHRQSTTADVTRSAVQLVMFLVVLRVVLKGCSAVLNVNTIRGIDKSKSATDPHFGGKVLEV